MDTEIVAAYLIRSYVWSLLKANNGMTEADYGGVVPIVPIAEEQELTQYDKPYIVYGYAESPMEDGYANRGNMSMVVYSTNFRKLTDIINTIARALEMQDETARNVNEYTSSIPSFVGLRFGHISLSYVEGGSPENTEGGRQSAAVNVRYEYYVNYDVKQYVPEGRKVRTTGGGTRTIGDGGEWILNPVFA